MWCFSGSSRRRVGTFPQRREILRGVSEGFFELELLDAITDLIAIETEERGGLRLIPAAALQRLDDQGAFELLEIDAVRRQADRHAEFVPTLLDDRKMVQRQLVALGEQHGALDAVSQ